MDENIKQKGAYGSQTQKVATSADITDSRGALAFTRFLAFPSLFKK